MFRHVGRLHGDEATGAGRLCLCCGGGPLLL
uniref:Uncharacterized protein n=1 Tax=Arundo donax TaxID=35708 RepID=A0A0A9C5M4_ARUDO